MLQTSQSVGKGFHSSTLKFLDHSQWLSNDATLIVTAVLRKMSPQDRWEQPDRHGCMVVRRGEKISTHSMQKTSSKGSLRQCFISQHTRLMKWEEPRWGTVTGSINVWFTWSKAISYPLGNREVMMHEHITFPCHWGFEIYEKCKKISCPWCIFIQRNIIGTVLKWSKSTY